MAAAGAYPRVWQYSSTATSSMFVRLRRSAFAARLRSFFTSEDNRTLKTAVFLLVIATAMYCRCHAFRSIRDYMGSPTDRLSFCRHDHVRQIPLSLLGY